MVSSMLSQIGVHSFDPVLRARSEALGPLRVSIDGGAGWGDTARMIAGSTADANDRVCGQQGAQMTRDNGYAERNTLRGTVLSNTVATAAVSLARDDLVVYEGSRGWAALDLRELWAYCELLCFLTWRDILVRYKQALLVEAWAILRCCSPRAYSGWCHTGSWRGEEPRRRAALRGLSLRRAPALGVLVRRALPLRSEPGRQRQPTHQGPFLSPGDPLLGGARQPGRFRYLLPGPHRTYGIAPAWHIVLLPLFVSLALAPTIPTSLWLSALKVLYRAVQYVIVFLVQLWMFVSRVICPLDKIPAGPVRVAHGLNPMTGGIGGFRWVRFGQQFPGGYVIGSCRTPA